MKKLLRKKVLITLVAVGVMAIAATAAYAWWTATASSGPNDISTAGAALTYGGELPVSAIGLVPRATLDDDPNSAVPVGYKVSYFFVTNNGETPLHFVGWLDNMSGDDTVLGAVVHVKITIAPTGSPWDITGSLSASGGPYLVYNGRIDALYGKTAGSLLLTTIGHSPLAAGQSAYYKVVTWLDGPTCNDDSQNKSMKCTLKFEGVPAP